MVRLAKYLFIFCFVLFSCDTDENAIVTDNQNENFIISGVDISSFPEIEKANPIFYNENGEEDDFLNILKNNGVNTVRLRLWVNPENEHSSFEEVKVFSDRLKEKDFKIWLTLHYSDTWADPGKQETPAQWQNLNFEQLKDSVENYTKLVVSEIQPEYIQIGNEINSGFLFPYGNIEENFDHFFELLQTASNTIRQNASDTQIMIHYAGYYGANLFCNKINALDYDIIGLSYYPKWHGKSLESLENMLLNLSNTFDKKIVIAETAYPFTLDWNDWTNNIIGVEEQLILPDFPATPQGQKEFINTIKTMASNFENGIGFCYWGAELIAWNGNQSSEGSPWENQALFDFENKALPVLKEFEME